MVVTKKNVEHIKTIWAKLSESYRVWYAHQIFGFEVLNVHDLCFVQH
jgi:hypothetical protein